MFRQIGLFDAFEDNDDIYFPVLASKCKFTMPIKIGSDIVIKTKFEPPKVAKFTFTHVVMDNNGRKYAEGSTILGMVSKTRGLIINLDGNVRGLITDYLGS
jgi:acyl-CoA thioesterase FadM